MFLKVGEKKCQQQLHQPAHPLQLVHQLRHLLQPVRAHQHQLALLQVHQLPHQLALPPVHPLQHLQAQVQVRQLLHRCGLNVTQLKLNHGNVQWQPVDTYSEYELSDEE